MSCSWNCVPGDEEVVMPKKKRKGEKRKNLQWGKNAKKDDEEKKASETERGRERTKHPDQGRNLISMLLLCNLHTLAYNT